MTDQCRQFDTLIARTAHLSTDEAARLEAHLAGCSACRELARAMKPLDSDLALAATYASMSDQLLTATASDEAPISDAPKDRYRITGEVGRGGLGRVMEALDKVLDRPVAIKELFSENATMRRRFVREALITARLQHPSIVPIYDVGHLGDRSPFYAMKLVAGQPLDKAVAGAHTLPQRLALLPRVLAVADAMAYAHSKRVIHRDLKPANILLGGFGETIVIDWGLAKDLTVAEDDVRDAGPYRAVSSDHTVAGAVLGTPAFMSPEQAAAAPVDERSDVYALGSILYHVVSGTAPHDGTTLDEMVRRVITGDVVAVTEREPSVPRDLAAIINKAMALAPANRYANAGGFAEDLRRFLTGQLVASHSYGVRELLRRWVKRHRAAVAVALAALVCMAVVGAVSVRRVMHARQRAEQQRSIAEREKLGAMETMASLFEEQGRQELLAGRPGRAAAYLSEAYAQTHSPGAGLRALLGDAMRSVEAAGLSLDGQTEEVTAAAFSRDGKRVVTAGLDDTARVWDAATGKLVAELAGHDDLIESASFSPDNASVLTASADQTARLWDAGTGKLVATLSAAHPLLAAGFSPDGAQIATTGEGGAVKLWDGRSAKLIASLAGHQGNVYGASFSVDGARLVTASADHTAKIWDVRAGKLARSLEGHRGEVIAAAFSPDGAQVVTASDDQTAQLWNAQTGAPLAALVGHRAPVHGAAFSPDGSRVVTASTDGSAKLWDAATGKLLVSLEGHSGAVSSAAFNGDGTRVVTAASKAEARLWDARTGKLLAALQGHGGAVTAANFDASGARVATASADHTAKLWDAATGKLLLSIEHPVAVESVAFNSDGTRLITSGGEQRVWIWNATSGALLARFERSLTDYPVRLSKDGTRILTAGMMGTASIKRVDTGELLVELRGSASPVYAAAFSPDGGRVITMSIDRTAKVWNAQTGELLASLDGITSSVFASSFSRDGALVITMGDDNSAKLWEVATGKLLASYDGHKDVVLNAGFSPEEGRVLTVSADRTAKLWDARTGKLLASLRGHTDELLDASFGADGSQVTTASRDGTLSIWDVHLEQREPGEIRRVVTAKDPWTLANGVLVPGQPKGSR